MMAVSMVMLSALLMEQHLVETMGGSKAGKSVAPKVHLMAGVLAHQ
jgi:hypothetical protein